MLLRVECGGCVFGEHLNSPSCQRCRLSVMVERMNAGAPGLEREERLHTPHRERIARYAMRHERDEATPNHCLEKQKGVVALTDETLPVALLVQEEIDFPAVRRTLKVVHKLDVFPGGERFGLEVAHGDQTRSVECGDLETATC